MPWSRPYLQASRTKLSSSLKSLSIIYSKYSKQFGIADQATPLWVIGLHNRFFQLNTNSLKNTWMSMRNYLITTEILYCQ